jgi:hypothetical protein
MERIFGHIHYHMLHTANSAANCARILFQSITVLCSCKSVVLIRKSTGVLQFSAKAVINSVLFIGFPISLNPWNQVLELYVMQHIRYFGLFNICSLSKICPFAK